MDTNDDFLLLRGRRLRAPNQRHEKVPSHSALLETTGAQWLKLGLEKGAPRDDVGLTVGPGGARSSLRASEAGKEGQDHGHRMKTAGLPPASQAGRRDLEKAALLGQGFSSLGVYWNHQGGFNSPRLQGAFRNNLVRTLGGETQASVFFQSTPGYSSAQTRGRTSVQGSCEHVPCSFTGHVEA